MRKFLKYCLCLMLILPAICFSKETLVVGVEKNVGSLNPHLYSSEMYAQDMVYESLVKCAENGEIQPWLAKSWEIVDGGKGYVFHLQENVKFSNGEIFDAQAVKANFDAILKNKERHKWMESASLLKSIEVLDKFTVKLNFTDVYQPILADLSLIRPYRFIAPSAIPDSGNTNDGIKAPIGTGPWVLTDSKLGVTDTFVQNKYYWGEKKPQYDEIVLKVLPEVSSRVVALKTNQIDMIYGNGLIGMDDFKELQADGKFNTYISKPITSLVIAMNSNTAPTNDLAVRQAINHAVDKDLINDKLFYGQQQKANALFNDNIVKQYAVPITPYVYDLNKANQILDAAGWVKKGEFRVKDNKELAVTIDYLSDDTIEKNLSEILQAQLKTIGIKVNIQGLESTAFYQKQKTSDFTLIFGETWGLPYEPLLFMSSMRVPSHADYQAQLGLKNKKLIDADISKALLELDDAKRTVIISDILQNLHVENIYLPITNNVNRSVANKSVGGIHMTLFKNHIPFVDFYPVKNK